MPDPLIELALRVQLSGVPPAYGSWLLTPRPPLHEGEKHPVRQGQMPPLGPFSCKERLEPFKRA